ncbi:hypothetical protein ACFHWD_03625 [Clostridium sp. MT-14]|uniref:hypothetical protein n=1 Tax=Clostridium sp. MT-14 TaxID=3348360 RepID=UPI0035F47BA5
MGDNYYFKLKNVKGQVQCSFASKELQELLQKQIDDIINNVSKIHIGKASAGWKALFQKTDFYASINEIKNFYNKNKDSLDIVNEYDDKLTLDELENELFNWSKDKSKLQSHLDDKDCYRDENGYEFCKLNFE